MIDWLCMLIFNPLTMMIVITVALIQIDKSEISLNEGEGINGR